LPTEHSAKLAPAICFREAQTASSKSSDICTIHQVGETGNDFYVVMELIEGGRSAINHGAGLSMEIVTRLRRRQIDGPLAMPMTAELCIAT